MNTKKNGFVKLLSFAIIAVILISVISFAVSGWQSIPQTYNPDNNLLDSVPPIKDSEDVQNFPKFYNVFTGLEISEESFNKTTLSYLINADSAVYGLSSADLTIEFPTEQSTNRLLFYSNDSNLWKIGSLSYTREYIDTVANAFGIPYINAGFDGLTISDEEKISSLSLNLSQNSALFYKENSKIFTSKEMINSLVTDDNSQINTVPHFNFGNQNNVGSTDAESIIVPYSNENNTEFYYSPVSKTYTYNKCGTKVMDMINGSYIEYKNIFILFSSSITYETSAGKELVLDTKNGGNGYYISEGKRIEILWDISIDGKYIFKTLDGNTLNVNSGQSYITFYKSFLADKIITK